MPRYELVNPSDHYEFTASSHEVACVAAVMLGEGRYGLKALDGDSAPGMPIFLFGGGQEWFLRTFNREVQVVLKEVDRTALADALESVAAFRTEDERTSLNNIGGYAAHLAKHFREALAKAPAP